VIKLVLLFVLTAVLYAAVGFGGGSTYTALLVLVKTDYLILPAIALLCNIIVVSGGSLNFQQKKLIPWQQAWPLFVLSIPFAFMGGLITIEKQTFILLLGSALLFAGITLLLQKESEATADTYKPSTTLVTGFIAALIGLLSGVVGIGGGIFLAPLLHLKRWAEPRMIAGVCSVFILVNSIAGLLGQTIKLSDLSKLPDLITYWPLFLAVFIGGQVGSMAGSSWLKQLTIKRLTAGLILFVAIRLLLQNFSGGSI